MIKLPSVHSGGPRFESRKQTYLQMLTSTLPALAGAPCTRFQTYKSIPQTLSIWLYKIYKKHKTQGSDDIIKWRGQYAIYTATTQLSISILYLSSFFLFFFLIWIPIECLSLCLPNTRTHTNVSAQRVI